MWEGESCQIFMEKNVENVNYCSSQLKRAWLKEQAWPCYASSSQLRLVCNRGHNWAAGPHDEDPQALLLPQQQEPSFGSHSGRWYAPSPGRWRSRGETWLLQKILMGSKGPCKRVSSSKAFYPISTIIFLWGRGHTPLTSRSPPVTDPKEAWRTLSPETGRHSLQLCLNGREILAWVNWENISCG